MSGYIYILTNPSFRGMVKIGMTRSTPTERARALSSSSGVPTKFRVAHSIEVTNPEIVERQVHLELDYCRVKGKEFFKCSVADANRALDQYTDPKLVQARKDLIEIRAKIQELRRQHLPCGCRYGYDYGVSGTHGWLPDIDDCPIVKYERKKYDREYTKKIAEPWRRAHPFRAWKNDYDIYRYLKLKSSLEMKLYKLSTKLYSDYKKKIDELHQPSVKELERQVSELENEIDRALSILEIPPEEWSRYKPALRGLD